MARAPDLTPMDPTPQLQTVTFDFGRMIASGAILSGTPTVTCAVANSSRVSDATPTTRIVGAAAIGPSPWSGLASQAVLQQFGSLVAGCTYNLRCTCQSSDGDVVSVWGYLPCDTPQ